MKRPPPKSAKGRPLAGATPQEVSAQSHYQNPTNPTTGHTIFVRPRGAKWALQILPPLVGEDLDRVFDRYEQARGFAGGLAMCRGYRVQAEKPRGAEA